jgi:hypothetical protein
MMPPPPSPLNASSGVRPGWGILVGGAGSSGTTLLRSLLDRHADIYCGPEWNVFCHPKLYCGFTDLSEVQRRLLLRTSFRQLPALRRDPFRWLKKPGVPVVANLFFDPRLRAEAGLDEEVVADRAVGAVDFWEFASACFEELACCNGKQVWAEKTPINCHAYAEFLAAHPGNRCLHVVRDGRDVAFSLMKRGFDPACAVDRWILDSATYLPFAAAPRVLLVRFEDLVDRPEEELRRVFAFLQIPIGDPKALIAPSVLPARRAAEPRGAAATWDASPEAEIDPSMAGKWRRKDAESLHRIRGEFARGIDFAGSHLTGDGLLETFGYPAWDSPA